MYKIYSTFRSFMTIYEEVDKRGVDKIVNKTSSMKFVSIHIDGLVQDCSNSTALAMELLQSCTVTHQYMHTKAH